MDIDKLLQGALEVAKNVGLHVLAALVLFFVGRRLIDLAVGMMRRALDARKVEETLVVYLVSTVTVLLNIALVIAILGYFGVETTTFAALLAAAGVAIGMAWSGLLANFAAGAFLIMLHPFKVGDFIEDLLAQLAVGTDHKQAIELLKQKIAAIPNVTKTPAPDVEIIDFNVMGPVLAVRPYTHTNSYWQVYFDTNRVIKEAFGEAGFAAPAQRLTMQS